MQRSKAGVDTMEEQSELIVRQATGEDVAQIAEIEKRCFVIPWSYESLHHDITENKRALYIVAEAEGKICGYVGVWKILDEGHITNVAVTPEYRRRHIASAMLGVLLAVLSDNAVSSCTLEVRAGNEAAKALYHSFGFVEAGVRKGYYEDNGEDAIIMWKEEI